MTIRELKGGNRFGTHRVVRPLGVLPQPAEKLDNDLSRLYDNEILVAVEALNVDAASFTQIKTAAGGDDAKIRQAILDIVRERGKLHNPVTGSGGMLIGRVAAVGSALERPEVSVGDRIASLVSLSLTPLSIDRIVEVRQAVDQVVVEGRAVLFESGLFARLPDDLPPSLALAVLDVAGAPAQTRRLVRPGDTVVVVGATGKSGVLAAYEAAKSAGPGGRVIGVGYVEEEVERLGDLGICEVVRADATKALECHDIISKMTGGALADVVINAVNVPGTEMASILMCRDLGTVYFFSMATSFTRAALGAEGVGKDVTMIIGNGYAKGHADIALGILRESRPIRELYEAIYAGGAPDRQTE